MVAAHVVLKKIGGAKFLLLELFVTTLGLLVALSLNNFVESRHHRDMVRQADAAMRGEIQSNTKVVESIKQQIIMANTGLDKDLAELADLRAHPDRPHVILHLNFIVISFDDTAWKTSQTAGAFVYMPYESASEFSSIYSTQQQVYEVQQQTIADMLIAASD